MAICILKGSAAHGKKHPDCPVEMTLQLIGDKWKVLIIRDLLTGTKRFNELMLQIFLQSLFLVPMKQMRQFLHLIVTLAFRL